MLGSTGGDLHATAIVGRARTFEDAGDLLKLTAHLLHHLLGSAAYSLHGHTTEQEGGHGADEGTHDHTGVHEVDLEVVHEVGDGGVGSRDHVSCHVRQGLFRTGHGDLDLLDVGGEKCQGGEGSRADGEALTCGGCRVAQCVEGIRAVAHLLTQSAHLGITAGIVGDGSVGVGGQCDAQCGEHTHGGDTDTIEAMSQGGG